MEVEGVKLALDVISDISSIDDVVKIVKGVSDYTFKRKLESFVMGINTNPKARAKFIAKMREDGKEEIYAIRIVELINRVEDIQKMRFINNLTAAFLVDFIDKEAYFRMFTLITDCIYEDLKYLQDHIEEKDLNYSNNVQALFSCGLMYQSRISQDGEAVYSFTPIARMLDIWALSYDDVDKHPDPTKEGMLEVPRTDIKAMGVWG